MYEGASCIFSVMSKSLAIIIFAAVQFASSELPFVYVVIFRSSFGFLSKENENKKTIIVAIIGFYFSLLEITGKPSVSCC